MKKFITNSVLFFILLISVNSIFFLINKSLIDRSTLKINPNVSKLILGDSHTECSINDSIVSNSFNLSESADSYFYSYQKLKLMVDNNKNIDTIFLGLSSHNLFKNVNQEWFSESLNMKLNFQDYAYLININDLFVMTKESPSGIIQGFFQIPRYTKTLLVDNDIFLKHFGGYNYLNKFNLKDATLKLKKSNTIERDSKFSDLEYLFLLKIIDFCKNNNIKLYFINTPLSQEYIRRNSKPISLFKSFYTKNLSSITMLDYSLLKYRDSCYADLDHLNYKGAILFSKHIDSIIKTKKFD